MNEPKNNNVHATDDFKKMQEDLELANAEIEMIKKA